MGRMDTKSQAVNQVVSEIKEEYTIIFARKIGVFLTILRQNIGIFNLKYYYFLALILRILTHTINVFYINECINYLTLKLRNISIIIHAFKGQTCTTFNIPV